MTHFLIMPVGPPGCGKSTVRRGLIERGSMAEEAVVSADDYRVILSGNKSCQEVSAEAFQIVDIVGRTRLERHLDVYLDGTNIDRFKRETWRARAHETRADIIYVRFDTPLDVLLARNNFRRHPVPPGVIERFHERATEITDNELPNGKIFHVYPDGEKEAIKSIARHIVTCELENR